MSTLLKKGLVPIFLIGAIFLTQLPTDASAQWHSRHEDLPGLVSTKSLILFGVGTAGAIFLLVKLSKSGKASETKAQESRSLVRIGGHIGGQKPTADRPQVRRQGHGEQTRARQEWPVR